MSEFIFIGNKISVPSLRDYIISHRIDQGDSLVVNPHDFRELIHEMKSSSGQEALPDFPLTLLGVVIIQDSTDTVPMGKLQIVKNESPIN